MMTDDEIKKRFAELHKAIDALFALHGLLNLAEREAQRKKSGNDLCEVVNGLVTAVAQ
jgi:hypothetical protein